jgi:pimeloyl-ACP methyl ester carboxylesterase
VAGAAPAGPAETGGAAPTRQTIRYTRSADGAMIAFATSGTGPPLLRAGHHLSHLELDWNSPFWRPHFDALGAAHTLVRYDIRGTGLSDAKLAGTSIEHHVADLAAVADAAGLHSFPLLASLQSTPVALRYMAQTPGRVSRLVIHNGYARGRAMRETAPESPDADPFLGLLRGGGWGDPANGFMRAWMSLVAPSLSYEDNTRMIEHIAGACPAENVIANRLVLDRFDATAHLGEIDVPTLVIHARNDSVHPLEEARILAAGIRGAEFLVVESANTLCVPADPTWQQQTDAILEFLARG